MRAVLVVAMVAAGLLAPATAVGGGWATVGLSSPPDDLRAGQTWVADFEVLQHGRTPLDGVTPSITITDRASGSTRTFHASPTPKPGVYQARVVFPDSGSWDYIVDDGFSQRHTYPPVTIGAAASTTAAPAAASDAGDGISPWAILGAAIAIGLVAAGVTTAVQRRRSRSAESTASGTPAEI